MRIASSFAAGIHMGIILDESVRSLWEHGMTRAFIWSGVFFWILTVPTWFVILAETEK
jgi:hypothetical protein